MITNKNGWPLLLHPGYAFPHADYTMQLREVCHTLLYPELINSNYSLTDEEIIEGARKKIFNFDYSFYTEEDENNPDIKVPITRKELETRIIEHFYMDEIGQETYAYWHHELKNWMVVNMPRFFSLFKTIPFQDQENPTWNTDAYEETNTKQNQSSKAEGQDKVIGLSSDTPQGRLDLENTNYVNGINETLTIPGTTNTSEAGGNTTLHRYGNIGVQTLADVLEGSRNAIITVENQLFSEMEDYGLFMLLF